MENLSLIEKFSLTTSAVMMLCLGLQIDVGDRAKKVVNIAWIISLITTWIYILLR